MGNTLKEGINRIAAVITAVEIVTLVGALMLMGHAAKAAVLWFVGILVEELLRYRMVKGSFPFDNGRAFTLIVVGVVVETVGPPHPNGSFVSSMPSGRTPKRGRGQPSSRAPRSGRTPVKPSFTFGTMSPRSTAVEPLASVTSCGAIVTW